MVRKKKVCIVSTSQVDNYGAVLQGFALETILKRKFDVRTLNYISEGLRSSNQLSFDKIWKKLAARILFRDYYKNGKIRHSKFEQFRANHLSLTEQYETNKICDSGLEAQYDYFLSGSDQVFNPAIYKGETVSFLDFVKNPAKKKTYAASVGKDAFLDDYKDIYKKYLPTFSSLLIREQSTAAAIENHLGLKTTTVLDPVFLLTKEQWEQAFKSQNKPAKKYLLTYILSKDDNSALAIREYARRKNLDVINIAGTFGFGYKKYLGKAIYPTPEEFVQLIANAECVFAKSFHGTAFSILFNKPYFYSCNDGDSTEIRIGDLEKRFGLPCRRIIGGKIVENEIDWDIVNDNIDKWRKYGLDCLFASLDVEGYAANGKAPAVKKAFGNVISIGAKCVGCENCKQVCPTGSITYLKDDEGFLYPNIDAKTCVHCGKCLSICPVSNFKKIPLGNICYAASSKQQNPMESSSGAIAATLYKFALEQGWKAFGVKWNANFTSASYFEIENEEDIRLAKKSKYVQAAKGNILKLASDYLRSGEKVLFIGCPCEVAALKLISEPFSSGLFAVDLVCHGPASESVLKRYLGEKKVNEPITSFCMRFKPGDGTSLNLRIVDAKSIAKEEPFQGSSFAIGMDAILRPSCYVCHNRSGDLTIGDFWGLPKESLGYNKVGTSLLIVNTEKGEMLFNAIKDDIEFVPENIALAISGNSTLKQPNAPSQERVKLVYSIQKSKKPIKRLYKKCLPLKTKAKMLCPQFAKRIIKSILKRTVVK